MKNCDGAFIFGIGLSTWAERFSFNSQRTHRCCVNEFSAAKSPAGWQDGISGDLNAWGLFAFASLHLGQSSAEVQYRRWTFLLSSLLQGQFFQNLVSICYLNNNNRNLVVDLSDFIETKMASSSLFLSPWLLLYFSSLFLFHLASPPKTAKGSEVTITLLHFTWPTQRKAISRQMRKTQTLWNSPGL